MSFWFGWLESLGLARAPSPPFPGAPAWPLPRSRAEVYKVFGDPGEGPTQADPKWERASMVLAKDLPGRWNRGTGRIYCHRLAEPYIRQAMAGAEAAGVIDEIRTFGCFAFRHQRHDAKRPLSYHSWGIAVDVNAADNPGVYIRRAPEPFSAEWRRLYPRGMSKALVAAFESAGWRWGGRWSGYCDAMHFELTRK